MKVLVLNSALLESLLDLDGLRVGMKAAMRAFASGQAQSFPRHVVEVGEGALGFMAARHSSDHLLGYKAVSVFKRNGERGLNPHQGLVVLVDPDTGLPRALCDGATITAFRTAAMSAAATDLLAVKNARHLALIGTGRQAFEHARAILKVRPIERISIGARSTEKAGLLTRTLRPIFNGAFDVADSPTAAAASADIVVSATSSSSPLFSITDLKAGAHLNAVGACRPGACEVSLRSRQGLKVYLDSRLACELDAEELIS
jgi:alanine dehydrogenase